MSNRQAVSPRELERTRHKAASFGERLNPEEEWIVDTSVAAKVVSLFPRLSIRHGLNLVTVAARTSVGGNGWTFAIPEGFDVPARSDFERAALFPPDPPRGALGHVMDAIDGDRSLRSYVQASILSRELDELGAWWHGLEWSTHTLLDNGDTPDAPEACSAGDDVWAPPLPADPQWRWEIPPPDDWRPTIERVDPSTTAVVFFTISGLGSVHITRHVDIYGNGSLRRRSSEHAKVAEGPGGFVF